jgi:tryptophan synthase alpha chain
MEARIMAHLVAGYPTFDRSLLVARALLDAGVAALEIQLPFSDPTADGPVIQEACGAALRNGFRAAAGFELVQAVAAESTRPIFVMTYGSVPYAMGIERFVERARAAGAEGVIVPDLPPDSDEGLYDTSRRFGLAGVPVLVPTATDERIAATEAVRPQWVYCALRTGTTGSRTDIGEENLAFLRRIKPSGAQVMAGFGVQARDQVEALAPNVDFIVVGSAIVRVVAEHGGDRDTDSPLYRAVHGLARELVSGVPAGS